MCQQDQAQPREVRFWRALRHAPGLHSLPAWHRGQPRESLGHHNNGANPRRQAGAESHGMFGGAKSIYLEVKRKDVAVVLAPEESRAFLLDPRGLGSPRQLKENTDLCAGPCPASTRRTSASVRCLDDPGRQCSSGSREVGRGAYVASPETGLFRQRGTLGDQSAVPTDPKADLRGDPRPTQAATLLPRSSYHSGLILPLG